MEAELDGEDTPELAAVKALAQYKTGSAAEATQAISELVAAASDNATVQIIGGIILHLDGKSDDAVALLSKHQGSLEA